MKRAYCLYRVSTLGQVDKDDIPMQRKSCRDFAQQKGWQILEEFSEKGVSGFKVSAEEREALVSIKQAAIQKQFDVLLVYMFDRLGRRDDETPFVVEWFVKNGIEVWSVMEGEQRFDDHIDKLLNYIRFWQASGESLKTSIRTRTRMEQIIRETAFVGGIAPYGYQLCKLGRTNKRGYDLYDILVNPATSAIVKEIFQLYCMENMGPHRIASCLNLRDVPSSTGTRWTAGSIRNILKNNIYTGSRKFGAIWTERFPHLQIVDDSIYCVAQQRLASVKQTEPRGRRSKNWDSVLLQDGLYCMHCGKPLTVTRNQKTRIRADGARSIKIRMKYICINKSHIAPCSGQRSYVAPTVDRIVTVAVNEILSLTQPNTPPYQTDDVADCRRELEQKIIREKETLVELKTEVISEIRGMSAFGPALLTELIQETEQKIAKLNSELILLEHQQTQRKIRWERFCALRKSLLSSQNHDIRRLSLADQQDIVGQLIERIEIGRSYQCNIYWSFGGIARLGAQLSGMQESRRINAKNP